MLAGYIADINIDAGTIAASEMPTSDIDDGIRIADAGTINSNIITSAFAYKLTGSSAYRDRAISEMMNAASFDDWNPKGHFLDTAGIMFGMAIGYDWLYNDLTDTQKSTVAAAIMEKGVIPAYNQHQSPYCNFNWTGNKTNWNFVCNSAAIMGALAVADIEEYKTTAAEVVSLSLQSMQGAICKFGIDGSWYESPEYGRYAMSYYYPATEAMRTALGTDYGYGSNPRTNAFCDYIIYISGGRSVFNYGDGGEALINFPGLFLRSKRGGSDFYAAYRAMQLQKTEGTAQVWDVLWYDALNTSFDLNSASMDRFFAANETATFRNGFFGDDLAFAGFHGGYNGDTHCQLDAGSFVYDAYGMRFACDEGQQDYSGAYVWTTNLNTEKNRWGYYRNRAESHNTLVINPDAGADQNPFAQAKMTKYKTAADYGFAVIDLTDTYADDVVAAKRGLYFNRTNGSLLVQDEFTLKSVSDVYWNMTFVAGPSSAYGAVAADGKSAVITRENKKVWVGILEGDGTFEIAEACPMNTSPNPNEWKENAASGAKNTMDTGWYDKLQLKLSGVEGSQKISIYMVPIASNQTAPDSVPAVTDIASWK